MAKNKKTTKKNSSSRLKKVTNWLKPTTPLKGMVLFALVFAIAGGGYYAYKSHAASWTVFPRDIAITGGVYKATDCNGNKGCIETVKMPAANNGYDHAEATIFTNFATPTSVFTCATVRAQVSGSVNPVLVLGDGGNGATADGYTREFSIPRDLTYRDYCTWAVVKAGTQFVKVQALNRYTGSEIYLSNISMRW